MQSQRAVRNVSSRQGFCAMKRRSDLVAGMMSALIIGAGAAFAAPVTLPAESGLGALRLVAANRAADIATLRIIGGGMITTLADDLAQFTLMGRRTTQGEEVEIDGRFNYRDANEDVDLRSTRIDLVDGSAQGNGEGMAGMTG